MNYCDTSLTNTNRQMFMKETLRREIKADIKKQHDLYVNNLVGDVKANPWDFYRYINSQKKRYPRYSPLEKEARKWSCPIRF